MNSILDSIIEKVRRTAKAGDYEAALTLANELVVQYSQEMGVWSVRAYVHELRGEYEAAVVDISKAIQINSMEPHFFFNRGRWHLVLGSFEEARCDFSKGIALCDHYNNDYYRETLLFMRAEALIRLGRRKDALVDLAHVRDNFVAWTTELRTKAALLAECAGPAR